MPIHFHPVLRAREEALESVGLIQPLDSAAVTIKKNQEASGQPKDAPVEHDYYYNNKKYRAK